MIYAMWFCVITFGTAMFILLFFRPVYRRSIAEEFLKKNNNELSEHVSVHNWSCIYKVYWVIEIQNNKILNFYLFLICFFFQKFESCLSQH